MPGEVKRVAKTTINTTFVTNQIPMLKQLFAGLITIASLSNLNAQEYIVTLQNDTLYGEVEILIPDKYTESVNIEVDGDKKQFKSHEVKGAFKDDIAYHTVKHLEKYRLMQLVEGGYLNYYKYRPEESYSFSQSYLLKATIDGLEPPNIGFRKQMVDFLNNCPTVVAKLEDKTYKKSDLKEIVAEYNSCLQDITDSKFQAAKETASEVQLIESIKSKVNSSEHGELITLLNDIKAKVQNKESIPSYLISALKEKTEPIEAIQPEVDQLLKSIK